MRPGELEQLYDQYGQALFAFALNLTRDESDARDIIQELFRRLSAHSNPLEGVRQERAYLLRLVHNLSVDFIRRRAARTRSTAALHDQMVEVFAPSDAPDEQAFRSELAQAMGELPHDQRVVVHLKLWEEFTFDEIAEMLGIPPNTAASRYRYGLDKLRARLRPLYDEIR